MIRDMKNNHHQYDVTLLLYIMLQILLIYLKL